MSDRSVDRVSHMDRVLDDCIDVLKECYDKAPEIIWHCIDGEKAGILECSLVRQFYHHVDGRLYLRAIVDSAIDRMLNAGEAKVVKVLSNHKRIIQIGQSSI